MCIILYQYHLTPEFKINEECSLVLDQMAEYFKPCLVICKITIYKYLSAAFITLMWKIEAVTIQSWPLLNTRRQCSYHNLEIHCDDKQVTMFKVQHLTKYNRHLITYRSIIKYLKGSWSLLHALIIASGSIVCIQEQV